MGCVLDRRLAPARGRSAVVPGASRVQTLVLALVLIVHGVLALALAVLWVRSAVGELHRRGQSFQFRIVDIYPGIVGLLPWLWLLSLLVQDLDDPQFRDWSNLTGQAWCLFHLLVPLGTGWALGVLNGLLDDPERKRNFLSSGLTIVVHQVFAVAVFILASFVFFVVVGVIAFVATK